MRQKLDNQRFNDLDIQLVDGWYNSVILDGIEYDLELAEGLLKRNAPQVANIYLTMAKNSISEIKKMILTNRNNGVVE